MDFHITVFTILKNYNSEIENLIKQLRVEKDPRIDFVVCSKFDLSKHEYLKSEKISILNASYQGVVDGFNQTIDFILNNRKETTHVLYVDDVVTLSKNPIPQLVSLLKKTDGQSMYSCYCYRESANKKYVYNDGEQLAYRELFTLSDIFLPVKKQNSLFNPYIFALPIEAIKNRKTPNYLYTFLGCNDSRLFDIHEVSFLNTTFVKKLPIESKMNPSDLYYFYRNSLIVKSFLKNNIDNEIVSLISDEIDANLIFYRYSSAMAICYAIEDFARGEKYLSELDLDYNNASIMHINPLLRTSNELELKYDWKKWNETRVVNDDNQRQLNLDSYGYVDDDATDYQVIDLYNQEPFTTFNTSKILNWDLDYFVGYLSEKNVYSLNKCLMKKNKCLIMVNDPIHYSLNKTNNGNKQCQRHDLDNKDIYDDMFDKRQKAEQRFKDVKIENNKVLFYAGTKIGFCGNPKYVLLSLLSKNPDLDIIWVAHKPEYCDEIVNLGVSVISLHEHERFLNELYSSKVIVYDDKLPYEFVPNSKQVLINTWHGGFNFKKIGVKGMEFDSEYDRQILMMINPKPKYFVAGCQTFLADTAESFNYPADTFVKTGLPRNDLLFKKNIDVSEIKKSLKLNEKKKICLYAPTFRDDNVASVHELNFKVITKALKDRFGGDWQIIYRGHTFTVTFWEEQDFVDVSLYPDQQELLAISDVVISDYSSIMWDAAILNIPIFIYAPDYYEYLEFERGFAVDFAEIPFILSLNNEELKEAIETFDEDKYQKSLSEFIHKEKTFDDGNASDKVSDLIISNLI